MVNNILSRLKFKIRNFIYDIMWYYRLAGGKGWASLNVTGENVSRAQWYTSMKMS